MDSHGNPPLLVAGDLFHKWNSPPEVVNRMIGFFPDCFAVPGNHDLPYHNYDDIKKSAYWTLVEAGKVRHLKPGRATQVSHDLTVTGFPYGHEPVDCQSGRMGIHVALIHDYCWEKGHTFPGAPEDKHRKEWVKRLPHYHGLIFGDNHQAFTWEGESWVRNGGCFIRQSLGEVNVQPTVGLIWSDGSLTQKRLMTGNDQIREDAEPAEDLEGFGEVVEELVKLEKTHVDFEAAVRRAVRGVSPRVRAMVLHYLGEGK